VLGSVDFHSVRQFTRSAQRCQVIGSACVVSASEAGARADVDAGLRARPLGDEAARHP